MAETTARQTFETSQNRIKPLTQTRRLDEATQPTRPRAEVPPFSTAVSEQTRPARPEQVFAISLAEKKRAKEFMNAAMSYHENKQTERAAQCLTKAMQLNPDLERDSYFNGIVVMITGLDEAAALAMLFDKARVREFVTEAKRESTDLRKLNHEASANEISWRAVAIDIWLYGLILTVGMILVAFVLVQSLPASLALVDDQNAQRVAEYGFSLARIGTGTIIMQAVIIGIISMIAVLIQNVAAHFAATRLLKGRGTMRFLLACTMPVYNTVLPLYIVGLAIAINLSVSDMGMIALLPIGILALISLVTPLKAAGRIGQAFDFGIARGLFALLFGSVVSAIIVGTISFVVSAVLS